MTQPNNEHHEEHHEDREQYGYRHIPSTESEFDHHQNWFYNGKEGFDAHRSLFMDQAHANQSLRDKLDNSYALHVSNNVETANLRGKAGLVDAGVATDQVWNLNEQIRGLTQNEVFINAIAAKVVEFMALGDSDS